jgi:hypothetical protein
MNKELKLLNVGSTKKKCGGECTADIALIAEKPKNFTILQEASSASLSGERTSRQRTAVVVSRGPRVACGPPRVSSTFNTLE